MGMTKRGKGTKLMALTDASGLSLGVHVTTASPHEVTLVEATLAANCAGEEPERLIGYRACNPDPLDEALAERGIKMIAPHRRNRRGPGPRTAATALWCRILSFEAPVRPAAVIEINRVATAGGITPKLERLTDSPGEPEVPT